VIFLLLFCCFQAFFVAFASLLNYALLEQVGWLTIVAGNLASASAMLGFFYLRRRVLQQKVSTSVA